MEVRTTIYARASRLSRFLIAVALLGILLVGVTQSFRLMGLPGAGPASSHATTGIPASDRATGVPSGSVADQQLRSILMQSRYEGGATVARTVDRITGYSPGSVEDQRLRALLTHSGYEGGGTVIRGASVGSE